MRVKEILHAGRAKIVGRELMTQRMFDLGRRDTLADELVVIQTHRRDRHRRIRRAMPKLCRRMIRRQWIWHAAYGTDTGRIRCRDNSQSFPNITAVKSHGHAARVVSSTRYAEGIAAIHVVLRRRAVATARNLAKEIQEEGVVTACFIGKHGVGVPELEEYGRGWRLRCHHGIFCPRAVRIVEQLAENFDR